MCKRNCSLPWNADSRHEPDDVPWLASAYGGESGEEEYTISHQSIAVCMAGQPRTIVHPHVWKRHVRTLHKYPIFMVLSTISTHHNAVYASALSAALHAIRPKRVRFLTRSFQPVCGDNTKSIQLHYLTECFRVIPSHHTVIVRTRPDHVWHVVPDFVPSIVGLKNTMVSRNDWAIIAHRQVFKKWSSMPLVCHEVCTTPPLLWAGVMGRDNEYCAFVAHLAKIGAGHMECSHPGERELFLRRAPNSRCKDLSAGQIVRWDAEATENLNFSNEPLVCEVGALNCRSMTPKETVQEYVDVNFYTDMPEMKVKLDYPWAYV